MRVQEFVILQLCFFTCSQHKHLTLLSVILAIFIPMQHGSHKSSSLSNAQRLVSTLLQELAV